ncbi:hypothetical protein KBZ21_11215 [Streptomyces sp. A73]|nr:hypothetical protein [Streptomyces sp. A73]
MTRAVVLFTSDLRLHDHPPPRGRFAARGVALHAVITAVAPGRVTPSGSDRCAVHVDWRIGSRHFLDLLVGGDVANNQFDRQWAAGTGTDTRPHRVLNPVSQDKRFDPHGAYVRRRVPELHDVGDKFVREPRRLPEDRHTRLDYPEPLTGLSDGLARFEHARGRD